MNGDWIEYTGEYNQKEVSSIIRTRIGNMCYASSLSNTHIGIGINREGRDDEGKVTFTQIPDVVRLPVFTGKKRYVFIPDFESKKEMFGNLKIINKALIGAVEEIRNGKRK